jgi:hypothetical protein
VQKGDELDAVETPDGVRLTTYDPAFAAQMEVAERIMREDRELLRKLAQQARRDDPLDRPHARAGHPRTTDGRTRRRPACAMKRCWNPH